MSLNRHATRTDANEKEIIRALEKIGAHVYRIKKPLDLLVCYRGWTGLLEVKTDKGVLTMQQKQFLAAWPGYARIVSSVSEAIDAVRCFKDGY